MSDPSLQPPPAVPPVVAAPVIPPVPEKVYDADYVRRLRAENDNHRQEADAAKAAQILAEQAAATRIADATAAANKRIVNAELRAEATKAGIVDLDGLLLLDADKAGVKIGDDGVVTGAEKALADLKAAKPFLFGTPKTGNTGAPAPADTATKKATEMSAAEYKAARAAMVARK